MLPLEFIFKVSDCQENSGCNQVEVVGYARKDYHLACSVPGIRLGRLKDRKRLSLARLQSSSHASESEVRAVTRTRLPSYNKQLISDPLLTVYLSPPPSTGLPHGYSLTSKPRFSTLSPTPILLLPYPYSVAPSGPFMLNFTHAYPDDPSAHACS